VDIEEVAVKLLRVWMGRSLARRASTAIVAALLAGPGVALAQTAPGAAITPAFREAIPNLPGKSMIAVVVAYPPGGKTPSHHHARSAFVTGYVLSGSIRSQVDSGAIKVYHAGESFSEIPGAQHNISENASASEPATLLAVFVVDTNDTELTRIDGK
jgi:quercetin dioxygenase-like cupin family protein